MRTAITGGIAEGKSTVLSYLKEKGHSVASADSVAREVFELGETQRGLSQLLKLPTPVLPSTLREALAERADLRRGVNRLMHPLILERLDALDANFIEVPLLIEACLQGRFDRVWVVTCGPEEQLRRLVERTADELHAQRMIKTQLSSRAKMPFADLVVRTNQAEENVRRFVSLAVDTGVV